VCQIGTQRAIASGIAAERLVTEGKGMKKQEVIRVFQLLGGVMSTLFLAGILVPSLMGSTRSSNHHLFPGSLRTIQIAGVAFQYKVYNIAAALLGTLCGGVLALVTAYRASTKRILAPRLQRKARLGRLEQHA
jgi:hypothetical protein